MALADELRNEVNIHKEMPWLKQEVISQIRSRGKFSIVCDTHINNINAGAVPYKYWSPIEQWAKQEGFSVYCSCNSYGVKHLCIEL